MGTKKEKEVMRVLKINEYYSGYRSITTDYRNAINSLNKEYGEKFYNAIDKILEVQPPEFFEDFDSFPVGEGHILQSIDDGNGADWICNFEWNIAYGRNPDWEDDIELSGLNTELLEEILYKFERDDEIMQPFRDKYIKKLNED